MIDHRLSSSQRDELLRLPVDWRNAYVGSDGEGGLLAWPVSAARICGAAAIEDPVEVVVESPVEELREEPSHRAPLASEAWMGECLFRVLEEGEWWLVADEDGYVAWMRSWTSRVLIPGEKDELIHRRIGVFAPAFGRLTLEDGGGMLLMGGTPLFGESDGSLDVESMELELVDGRRAHLSRGELELFPHGPFSPRIASWARELEGVSYRWGGRTAMGIDCSGLVQWAALRAGYELPRDAAQQSLLGEMLPLDSSSWRAGDLLFFHDPVDHVAIYDGEETIIHARARVVRQRLSEAGELHSVLSVVRRLTMDDRIRQASLWRRPQGLSKL